MSSPISGFTAIPNPQMLAFMPIQSYLMMYFAGSAWQFGKRKISAMSNDEFNKLDMKTLLEQHTIELKSVIPTLERSLNDITPLIGVLIEQYGDFIKEAIRAIPQALQNAIGGGGEFSNIPTSSGLGPTQTASFLHYFKTLSDATKTNISSKSGLGDYENTEAKRIALQAEFNKEFAKQKLLLEAQIKAEARADIREFTPQLGIIESQSIALHGKKKAGQSQILERAKLINQIQLFENEIRSIIKKIATATSGLSKTNYQNRLKGRQLLKQQSQQALANLQGRYQF